MTTIFSPWLGLGCATLALLLIRRLRAARSLPLPPGPKSLPIIGNILDMPTEEEWKTFSAWGDTYGDLMSVTILGQPIIILNSFKHASALLDKRSGIYSSRPRLMMGGEIVGYNKTLALLPYGETFKQVRRLAYRLMGSKANLEPWIPLEELESHRLLKRIYQKPDNVAGAIRL